MSRKKARRNSEQGTYALCITTGLIIGVGLGAILDSVVLVAMLFGIIGGVAAYLFNHRKKKRKS